MNRKNAVDVPLWLLSSSPWQQFCPRVDAEEVIRLAHSMHFYALVEPLDVFRHLVGAVSVFHREDDEGLEWQLVDGEVYVRALIAALLFRAFPDRELESWARHLAVIVGLDWLPDDEREALRGVMIPGVLVPLRDTWAKLRQVTV